MKRWKLLTGAVIIILMSVAATTPPYYSRASLEEEWSVAVDSAGDSTYLVDTFIFKVAGFNYLDYRIIFTEDDDSLPGQGLSDSIMMRLSLLRGGIWYEYDSAYGTVATDTLEGKIQKAVGDTLFNEYARITLWFADTTSDTTATMEFDYMVELFGKVSP